MTARECLVALSAFENFGPARINLFLKYFGDSRKAWVAKAKDYLEIGLNSSVVDRFEGFRKHFEKSNYFIRLKASKIDFTTIYDTNYPENLREISDCPPVLYFIGHLRYSDKNAVAIVGSRKMSSYGREVTRQIASELAGLGVTIVSGLALGIDAVAHRACIEAGGRGIIVLASGLDIISPIANRWIAVELVKKGGAIVSEYPLGRFPFKTSFPARNRIISGLSRAVIVVEGYAKSGTLLTASAAAEQGRTVFAVPGPINSPLSQAPHYLIQNGAKLVNNSKDIIDELDFQLKISTPGPQGSVSMDKEELLIAGILANESMHVDEIARSCKIPMSLVASKLTVMELKGIVKNIGQGIYRKL